MASARVVILRRADCRRVEPGSLTGFEIGVEGIEGTSRALFLGEILRRVSSPTLSLIAISEDEIIRS